MRKATRPSAAPKTKDPKVLQVEQKPEESGADALAHASLRPTMQAALTLMDYNKCFGEISINTLVDDLSLQCNQSSNGDLSRAEAMLTTQAHTLDTIFNNLARRAAQNMGEYLGASETYLRLALKAQSQCRATLETLAAIKNPPVVYARQANVTTGPQQINNGTMDPPRTREIKTEQNELSRKTDELLPDARASTLASRNDSPVEAVGKIDRAEVQRR